MRKTCCIRAYFKKNELRFDHELRYQVFYSIRWLIRGLLCGLVALYNKWLRRLINANIEFSVGICCNWIQPPGQIKIDSDHSIWIKLSRSVEPFGIGSIKIWTVLSRIDPDLPIYLPTLIQIWQGLLGIFQCFCQSRNPCSHCRSTMDRQVWFENWICNWKIQWTLGLVL